MSKNLTLKRLIRIMESIAPEGETVGESFNDNQIIVREGSHLSGGALFFVAVESSSLYYHLNGYGEICDWKEHTALTEALDEYGVFWEWYDSVCFHIYEV